jgi:hypothetical protein
MTARKHTISLIEMMDDGILSPQFIAEMALNYMSEQEVEDMMRVNDLLEAEEADEEWTPDNADFNDFGSRHHY